VFDSVAVARWWAERAARKAVAAGKAAEPEGSFAERRAAAEARTAEIAAARAQLALERELGEVVSVADYETALGTVLDRLTARLRAMPVRLSHFGADVELAAESEVERLVVQLNAWDDDVIEEADPEPPPSAGIAA
jgi:phage terminase Nu1 subunit (DNA packaging protein)